MYTSIDEHINSFPEKERSMLIHIREIVHSIAPDAVETISYGIPTFKLNGKNLLHFAGYKNHIGFYPSPNGMEAFKNELEPYASGKGTAQFPWDKPLPVGLIKKIVMFRVEELNK